MHHFFALLITSAVTGFVLADPFLSGWMGALLPVIENQTLLDLTLPGTHDTNTVDDSDTVADNANSLPPALSWLFHEFRCCSPGKFIRNQSITQGLTLTDQLNNGIRFLDFRIVYSAPPDAGSLQPHDWYSMHMCQSKHTAMTYLQEVRQFLDNNPSEIVVIWLSYHGNTDATGTDQYPNVKITVKQAFWRQIEALFDGLLFDTTTSSTNTTTIAEMLVRKQRVVVYAADWVEFTNSSTKAINTKVYMENDGCADTGNGTRVYDAQAKFAGASALKKELKKNNTFYLLSMAAGFPSSQITYAALLHYTPLIEKQKHLQLCAVAHDIPGMTDWCPMHLIEESQLTNYYNQIVLDMVISGTGYDLPNGIYLGALDFGGQIRTGSELLWPASPSMAATASTGQPKVTDNNTTGFGYVDTLLLYNVRQACRHVPSPVADCQKLTAQLEQRRSLAPLTLWNDPAHGRLINWPPPKEVGVVKV